MFSFVDDDYDDGSLSETMKQNKNSWYISANVNTKHMFVLKKKEDFIC